MICFTSKLLLIHNKTFTNFSERNQRVVANHIELQARLNRNDSNHEQPSEPTESSEEQTSDSSSYAAEDEFHF